MRIIYIPGGSATPQASSRIVKHYSNKIGTQVIQVNYPEFVYKNFKIDLLNYQKYFQSELLKYKDGDCVVIGFSLGAYFALSLAAEGILNPKKVILISPFIKKPGNFIYLLIKRIKSLVSYENNGKLFVYPIKDNIFDLLKYGSKFIEQYKNIFTKLDLTRLMKESQVKKVLVIGKKDDVIPPLMGDELKMKNSKVIWINGNHDLITNQMDEVLSVIKSEIRY